MAITKSIPLWSQQRTAEAIGWLLKGGIELPVDRIGNYLISVPHILWCFSLLVGCFGDFVGEWKTPLLEDEIESLSGIFDPVMSTFGEYFRVTTCVPHICEIPLGLHLVTLPDMANHPAVLSAAS